MAITENFVIQKILLLFKLKNFFMKNQNGNKIRVSHQATTERIKWDNTFKMLGNELYVAKKLS